MFRNSIAGPLRRVNQQLVTKRSFSVAAVRMAEGDTGAPRSGGAQASDQFTRREAAQENIYVKEKEMERLRELKSRLKEQRKHLDELDKHIDQLTREQGGEQN